MADTIDAVVQAEAKFAVKELRAGMRSQAPGGRPYPPVSEATMLGRRAMGVTSTKRLIVSGTLEQSLTTIDAGRHKMFAGFPDKVVQGRNMAQIAAINEFGTTIVQRVTERQRRYLAAILGGASRAGTTMTIRIPPAPTVGPVFDEVFRGERARRRIRRRATRFLRSLSP